MLISSNRPGEECPIEANGDGFAKAVGTPHTATWHERICNPRVLIDGPVASVCSDYTFHAADKFPHCGIDLFLFVKEGAGARRILEPADTRRTEECTP